MPKISVEPGTYILWAVLLMTLPLKWLFAAVFAAVFHELCHIFAILLLGGKLWNIRVGAGGAVLDIAPIGRGRELLCALAGPLGSIALCVLFSVAPRVALCGGIQALYNLLPVYPLDGGRVLRCIIASKKVCDIIEHIVLSLLLMVSILGFVGFQTGLLPVLVAAIWIIKALARKRPCKPTRLRVQ